MVAHALPRRAAPRRAARRAGSADSKPAARRHPSAPASSTSRWTCPPPGPRVHREGDGVDAEGGVAGGAATALDADGTSCAGEGR
jgi:hypothetical protein